MKTWITDNFPLNKLECQYSGICNDYLPGDCAFDYYCPKRQLLKEHLEDYVQTENLKF